MRNIKRKGQGRYQRKQLGVVFFLLVIGINVQQLEIDGIRVFICEMEEGMRLGECRMWVNEGKLQCREKQGQIFYEQIEGQILGVWVYKTDGLQVRDLQN